MILGIDLGTTNSLVGVWRDGEVTLIPNSLGHVLTPSAVGLGDDRSILVGLAARERLATHPAKTATAFKRYMGTDRLLFVGDKGYRPRSFRRWSCARSRPMRKPSWARASRKP